MAKPKTVYVCSQCGNETAKWLSLIHILVLLCENNTGYQNLIEIVSRGFTEGFYSKPRVDRELLSAHHEGLICLSALSLIHISPAAVCARENARTI